MISKEEAQALALEHASASVPVTIVTSETVEKPYGWVFFWDSSAYLKSRVISDALAGNGPILVNKNTGVVSRMPTFRSLDAWLRDYERQFALEILACVLLIEGQVFVPSTAKDEAGFFIYVSPVAVLDANDRAGIELEVGSAIARGCSTVASPGGMSQAFQVVLEHSKNRSRTFLPKSTKLWGVRRTPAHFVISAMRRTAHMEWEDDEDWSEVLPLSTTPGAISARMAAVLRKSMV